MTIVVYKSRGGYQYLIANKTLHITEGWVESISELDRVLGLHFRAYEGYIQ